MKPFLLTVAIVLGVSSLCFGATPEIRLPPFPGHDRKGSYDVELKRIEAFNGKQFPPVEGNFHVDVADASIRVILKRLTFSPIFAKYQSEDIYSKRNGSMLMISTETGTAPSRVAYSRHIDDEPSFYGGTHGVNVINGCFWNLTGSLWDDIREHAEALVAKKPILLRGAEVDLVERKGYWLLRCVRIHLDGSQQQLYSPKFYAFEPPSKHPLSAMQKLDCDYGAEDREQKYRYEQSCKYENGQIAGIQMEISVINYRPDVATPPQSDDMVYSPTLVPIPNGTSVGVVDETKIDYVWKDGRIVKRIDGTAIDAAESVFFRSGSRLFLVLCALTITLALITLWIVRLRWKIST